MDIIAKAKELGEAIASSTEMANLKNRIIFSVTGEEPCSTSKCSSCGGCK